MEMLKNPLSGHGLWLAVLLAAQAASGSVILVSAEDSHTPAFQPEARYEAHYVGNGNLNRGLSRFAGSSIFFFTDLFFLSPVDLPGSARLDSLLLDLRPVVENRIVVQKPQSAPNGNFATTRQVTSAAVFVGSFFRTYAAPGGVIDLLAAGVTRDDLDNNPMRIEWTTTITFSGQPLQPGVKNSDPVYLVSNTGSSVLFAEMSGSYTVPEPPAYALVGVGLIAGVMSVRRLRRLH
jgi:hypothetical protein